MFAFAQPRGSMVEKRTYSGACCLGSNLSSPVSPSTSQVTLGKSLILSGSQSPPVKWGQEYSLPHGFAMEIEEVHICKASHDVCLLDEDVGGEIMQLSFP